VKHRRSEDKEDSTSGDCGETDHGERGVEQAGRRLLRRGLLVADNVFQLERLYAFNRKFFPEWRPRYLCVERLSDLPLVGLAYLHVEQLLVPPGPWVKRDRKLVSH